MWKGQKNIIIGGKPIVLHLITNTKNPGIGKVNPEIYVTLKWFEIPGLEHHL